jgi:transposase
MSQRYSEEFKENMLKRMMAPNPVPVMQLCRETGVSDVTLYKWKRTLLGKGLKMVEEKHNNKKRWSKEEKLMVLIETASMNEHERSEYCRTKGLYPEQIEEWKRMAFLGSEEKSREEKEFAKLLQEQKKENKRLESELKRKDKALAEAAALLVLSKKWNAYLGAKEED